MGAYGGDTLAKLKAWVMRTRDQFSVGIVLIVGTTTGGALLVDVNPMWVVILANVGMMGILVLQQANVGNAISRLREIVVYELGVPWGETQYNRRRKHFVAEKELLAQVFVEDVLPALCEDIQRTVQGAEIRVILDSGTTITPIFEHLLQRGVRLPSGTTFEPKFYTNNLAGIDELQKLDHLPGKKLSEVDFTLIGGTPLSRYRATTGEITQKTLDSLFAEQAKTNGKIVTVGVLTANWLLLGHGRDNIAICARGRGHREFKEQVKKCSDRLVVIAPLGKILALDDVKELNELQPEEKALAAEGGWEYEAISLGQKDTTYLLTSKRPEGSNSPLAGMSNALFMMNAAVRKNFTLHEACPDYAPPGTEVEVRTIEMPHAWTRPHARRLFGTV